MCMYVYILGYIGSAFIKKRFEGISDSAKVCGPFYAIGCSMNMNGLPDMYTKGLAIVGIHIRLTMSIHGKN